MKKISKKSVALLCGFAISVLGSSAAQCMDAQSFFKLVPNRGQLLNSSATTAGSQQVNPPVTPATTSSQQINSPIASASDDGVSDSKKEEKVAEFDWKAAPTEQFQQSLTLREAILRAFSRNPQISQAAAQIRIGDADLDLAKSALYPQISLQASEGRSHRTDSTGSLNSRTTYGVTLNQLLYDFGQTLGSIGEQKNLSAAYQYQLYNTMSEVAQQTIQAYLQVKQFMELVKVSESSLDSLEKVKTLARLRAEAGLSSQSDILQAETRIAGALATLEQNKAQFRSAKARLSVLTGVVPEELPDLPSDLSHQKISLDNIPYEQNHQVKGAWARQLAVDDRIDQVKSMHWPTVRLQAERTRSEGKKRSYWDDQVRVVMDAPIYQGGAVNARLGAVQGEKEAAQALVDRVKLEVNQMASIAYADLIGAKQREQAGEQQLLSAKHTREVYRDEYRLNKRSLNDLLSVEQEVVQADNMRIVALYDSWDATTRYAAAVDNLLDMLSIQRSAGTSNELPALQ